MKINDPIHFFMFSILYILLSGLGGGKVTIWQFTSNSVTKRSPSLKKELSKAFFQSREGCKDLLTQGYFPFLLQVTLTVDGVYTERWMGSGGFSFLASTTAFLGGSEATYSLPGTKTNNNLVGCLKKVTDIDNSWPLLLAASSSEIYGRNLKHGLLKLSHSDAKNTILLCKILWKGGKCERNTC